MNGCRVSVWEDEKHSKDCVHNNINIFSTDELTVHIEMTKMVNVVMYIFITIKL